MPHPTARAERYYREFLQAHHGSHRAGASPYEVVSQASQDRDAFVHFEGFVRSAANKHGFSNTAHDRRSYRELMGDWHSDRRTAMSEALKNRLANTKLWVDTVNHAHQEFGNIFHSIGQATVKAGEAIGQNTPHFHGYLGVMRELHTGIAKAHA